MKILLLLVSLSVLKPGLYFSQTYTSYFTGNTSDLISSPSGGICMMGGGDENDEAMKWFLQRADHGDVLVLRTDGANEYNNYMFSGLGETLNSLETIVFDDPTAADEAYIHQKIRNAEAIWFAGGDQWEYISYWRNTAIDSLINDAIHNRNIVMGGTSAGMSILGGFYFSAEHGNITSAAALNNPYHVNLNLESLDFIRNNYLSDVITDTDYGSPNMRKGRHVTFMARIVKDYGVAIKGIACDQHAAVCIDASGMAHVYGNYPSEEHNAYFLQTNCELSDIAPENCTPDNHLQWNLDAKALKVYHVLGTMDGANTFNLNDWKSGSGGTWENWFVPDAFLSENLSFEINCPLSLSENQDHHLTIYPNPTDEILHVEGKETLNEIDLFDLNGKLVLSFKDVNKMTLSFDLSQLTSGVYYLKIQSADKVAWENVKKN